MPDYPAMVVGAGSQIGPYRVLEIIGAGGMGQVYRARDTTLNRDVALKLLPPAFASDPDRLARFRREAQFLAALNHPHIAQIYGVADDDGTRALVMELVPGPTLADLIATKRLTTSDALFVARQIADALEAAHDRGIIHRDLKPANIKLQTTDPDADVQSCRVKVLDFGLAKALDTDSQATDADLRAAAESPTMTSPAMTSAGMILGTATYMSPEQARGRLVDRRADIWAFGAVLFEMLAGRPAFAGDDVSDTLANVLKREPDWTALPADVPERVRQVLRACLQKPVKNRLADMQDVRLALDGAFETSAAAAVAPPSPFRRPVVLAIVGAILASAVVTGAASWWWRTSHTAVVVPTRLSIVPPRNRQPSMRGSPTRPLAVSPDGELIAYVALAEDTSNRVGPLRTQLVVRAVGSRDVRDVPGAIDVCQPFFSPDGRWIAFFTLDGELRKVARAGGNPITLVKGIIGPQWSFGVWLPDDTIVFSTSRGLERVGTEGGRATLLTPFDPKRGEGTFSSLTRTSSGKAVLFSIWDGRALRIGAVRVDSGARVPVLDDAGGPLVGGGRLLFWRGDTPLVAAFDEDNLKVTGPAVPVPDDVALDGGANQTPQWALSETGTLVYLAAIDATGALGLVTRSGTFEPLPIPRGDYRGPRVSPDGRTIAVTTFAEHESAIGLVDLDRNSLSKVPFKGSVTLLAWNPQGQSLAAVVPGTGIIELGLDGSTRLMATATDALIRNASWAPDGRTLAYTWQQSGLHDIWIVTPGDPAGAKPWLNSPAAEHSPAFSPDGRWIAYVSNESGQPEIYVRRYPQGPRVRVSNGGGTGPVWRRDGREIFFEGRVKDRASLIAVPITATGESLVTGTPVALFPPRTTTDDGLIERYAPSSNAGVAYDVLPDQRFVMVRTADPSNSREIVVAPHWLDEIASPRPASNTGRE